MGKPFFDGLPKEPGVYLMHGSAGRLLYVGKAKNLRSRLFSYRRVSHDNSSRKIRRLVRMTHDIKIQLCENEEAALLKENKLIRESKPEFNHAKKSPETYYFLTLRPGNNVYHFRLSMQKPSEEELGYTYGAFKGHRTIRKGTGALLRQLYLLEHEVNTPFDFPTVLTNKLTPLRYDLHYQGAKLASEDLQLRLTELLCGESLRFLEHFIQTVSERALMDQYVGRLILKDCESIRRLYDHCFQRNYELKQMLKLSERIIPQKKLDDYLIQAAFSSK